MDNLIISVGKPCETLGLGEVFWRDHNTWLKEMGYQFRPRYQPGWVPSWIQNPKLVSYNQEDYQCAAFLGLDAKRIVDGTPVNIKQIAEEDFDTETEMTQYFHSTPTLQSDPTNHCVLILEVMTSPDDSPTKLMVLPYLIPWDAPKFYTIGEAVDFFEQIFEGIAHCDAKTNSIMIEDGLRLYETPNVIRENFTHGHPYSMKPKRRGFEFMDSLIEDMCNTDPTKRPTMDVVVERFQTIKQCLSSLQLRSRIANVDERPVVTFRRDVKHVFRVARDIIFWPPAVPDYRRK